MAFFKFNPNDFTVKKLYDKVDLSCFKCCDNDDLGLDEFIHKEAFKYQQEGMGVTYLFYNDAQIAGYVTVAMGSIGVKMTDVRVDVYDKKRYPAVWLGRLAVHNMFRKRDVGKCMIRWVIGLALKSAEDMGCRFIVLVTKGENRIEFYTKCGFKVSHIELDDNAKMLFFPLPSKI